MSQIQAGHTYTSTGASSLVTASNLNQHVNNAQLVGGAITEQTINSATADTDLLLIAKGGSLYSQTKLQFTDTLNSQTINVNDLSVDTASIDSLTLSHTTGSVLDLGLTNVVVKGAYPTMRFGFDAYTGAPPTGSSYLGEVSFATRDFQVYNPDIALSGAASIQFVGNVEIRSQPTYTNGGVLHVEGQIFSKGEPVVIGNHSGHMVLAEIVEEFRTATGIGFVTTDAYTKPTGEVWVIELMFYLSPSGNGVGATQFKFGEESTVVANPWEFIVESGSYRMTLKKVLKSTDTLTGVRIGCWHYTGTWHNMSAVAFRIYKYKTIL